MNNQPPLELAVSERRPGSSARLQPLPTAIAAQVRGLYSTASALVRETRELVVEVWSGRHASWDTAIAWAGSSAVKSRAAPAATEER